MVDLLLSWIAYLDRSSAISCHLPVHLRPSRPLLRDLASLLSVPARRGSGTKTASLLREAFGWIAAARLPASVRALAKPAQYRNSAKESSLAWISSLRTAENGVRPVTSRSETQSGRTPRSGCRCRANLSLGTLKSSLPGSNPAEAGRPESVHVMPTLRSFLSQMWFFPMVFKTFSHLRGS